MKNLGKWFVKRAKEPSTATAVAGFLAATGFTIDPGLVQDILVGVAGLLALAGIVVAEKGKDVE